MPLSLDRSLIFPQVAGLTSFGSSVLLTPAGGVTVLGRSLGLRVGLFGYS